ncbi:MAG: LacI family DNA-binding transcriptional regulator [Oscillospiraceae bacterium]|nr:LacI family DNA-binding transcriptional regulator [Oscillospiraceae bacterium]
MVSMKDIALHCGVSVATVSKALNGHQDIGEATRERIMQAAKEMGYTANSAARALKTNRTYNLGILFVDLQNSGLTHEYFAAALNSFRIEAERSGYDITFINSNVGHQNRSYLQHALYRGVDGVAIICVEFHDPLLQELVYSGLPVVTLDHAFHNRSAVLSDNMNGMESLVRFAYQRGHRRIAYIRGDDTAVTENRMTGFFRACEALGLTIPNEYLSSCHYHEPHSCYEATKKILALPNRPSCILFPDDYACIGGINAIREAGLHIPEDISVIGYDGMDLAKTISPRLTTWEQNTADLGRIAASQLIACIEHPRTTPPEHITVPGRLLEGESVARI